MLQSSARPSGSRKEHCHEGLRREEGQPVLRRHLRRTRPHHRQRKADLASRRPDRKAAETLASKLAAEVDGANDTTRSLTFGAFLTGQWLPGKANTLAESTWHGYRRKIERHILPTLGTVPIRRLKVTDLEALYDTKLRPTDPDVKELAPKTVLEIHLIIRGALTAAVKRGILTRTVAHAPRLRSIPKHEAQAWTAEQLSVFLQVPVQSIRDSREGVDRVPGPTTFLEARDDPLGGANPLSRLPLRCGTTCHAS